MQRASAAMAAIAALLAAAPAVAAPEPLDLPAPPTNAADARVTKAIARLPLSFEVNRGQAPEEFDFLVRCRGYRAFVAADAVVFSFGGAGVRMSLEGASRAEPQTAGLALPGKANYLLGDDPAKWITKIPTTRGAVYPDAAPGVSWRFGSRDRALEFEFDVAPGAGGPRLAFDGADTVTVGADGVLCLAMPRGVARISAPVAWQDVPGARLPVAAKWLVGKDGGVRIDVKPRDPSLGVRIDPSVTYETYLGGTGEEQVGGVAVDAAGAAYVCGSSRSTNFPTTAGAYSTTKKLNGSSTNYTDVSVTKLSASGTSLVYSTYVGGNADDSAQGIAVDASGNAVITGGTYATDYPTTQGVYRSSSPTGGGFITKLNSNGSGLVFSTMTQFSGVAGAAFGPSGGIYVIEDYGVSLYSATGSSQVFHTRLRPTSTYYAQGMSVNALASDADGAAYVAGGTDMQNFSATSGAYQTTLAGLSDAFVTKFSATGSIAYTTFLGGTGSDSARAIGVGLSKQPFVAGDANSTDFPVTSGAYRTTSAQLANGGDSFLSRLDASGKSLRSSTFLGVPGAAVVRVHAGSWCVVLGGTYYSSLATSSAFQASLAGDTDGFLIKFNRDNTLAWSSYWGGTGSDYVYGFGMGPDGTIAAGGNTLSTDMPTVSPYQSTLQGSYDLMLVKVPDSLPTNLVATSVVTDSLPTWTVGYAYSAPNLEASGGIGPYVWSKVSGSLPPGASLSSSGAITGTLTQTGTFTFRVHVEETCEIATEKDLTITVNPPPTIASAQMPQATIGTDYDRTVPVANGSGTMTFAITAGTAPPAMGLTTDGRLVGAPSQLGDFSFTVQVTDGRGATGSRQVTLHVNDTPLVTADVVPAWTETFPYTMQFHAARGSGGFTWKHVGGTLPISTPLDTALGKFNGPAASAGAYVFTLRATDSAGAFAERTFTMTVNAMPQITSTALPPAAIGRPYSAKVALSGGTPPFLWKLQDTFLPPGLLLDGDNGVVHGSLIGPATGPVQFVCSDRTGAVALGTADLPTAEFADLKKKKWSEKFAITEGAPAPVLRYLELTAGCTLGIGVKGGGQIDAGPEAHLVDADGAEVDLAQWTHSTIKSLTVKGAAIARTGRYFLTIVPAPEAKGKMAVSVSVSPPAAWKSGASLGPDLSAEQTFSAPPGAKLAISVKATKGSTVLPHIVSLVDADGADLLAGGHVVEKGGVASFTSKTPLTGGDYRVKFSARDANVGSMTWVVSVKMPKTYAFTMDAVPAGD